MRMGSIIIALPKREDAIRISDMLMRRGLETTVICTTAANVLSHVHRLDGGIVISGSRLSDMHYTQLAEYLPDYFEMLLIASPTAIATSPRRVMSLPLPLKANDLVGTVEMMLQQLRRRIKRQRPEGIRRSEQEQQEINRAKSILMERNHMTEQEAFRYIQKCSMDSGTNMAETAQMILLMMQDKW